MATKRKLKDRDYQQLLEFRTGLRRFLHWSQSQATEIGLPPMQHQLLLAIRGHPDKRGPTIGEVAKYLVLKPHSAVELVNRAESAGLVERVRHPEDRPRVTRLRGTPMGLEKLEFLTKTTLLELKRLSPELTQLWEGLEE